MPKTPARKKEINRKSYQKHRQRRIAENAAKRTANPELARQKDRESYRRRRAKILSQKKLYHALPTVKARAREYFKEYREKNRDRCLALVREWYRRNRIAVLQEKKEYGKANRKRITEWRRKYVLANRERVSRMRAEAYRRSIPSRRVYLANPRVRLRIQKWARGYFAKWRKENPARCRNYAVTRMARKMGNGTGDLLAIGLFYHFVRTTPRIFCHWCGDLTVKTDRTVDHVIPLARKGKHCLSNLVHACRRCNCRKHDMMPEEFKALLESAIP